MLSLGGHKIKILTFKVQRDNYIEFLRGLSMIRFMLHFSIEINDRRRLGVRDPDLSRL